MVDFNKVDEYISYIEEGTIPQGMTFNEFAMEFYHESKVIPMSKYLRSRGRTSKMPKIMNTKKAGEILYDTLKSGDEIKTFLKRKGFDKVPELNYTLVMLVRKIDLLDNWKKIIAYLQGDKTIEEINNSTKTKLLPGEVARLEEYIMEELNIDEDKLNWFLSKFSKLENNRELFRAVKKLNRQ
ncbi:hypothetical protein [Fusobacterium sp.]|uniref:hypothetical protein n=1 Tax=Fusobacterium sp. TaxID=68766 RepID=UPI002635AA41|nr:hypothetical protein [Fusobacterium sp.]